MSITPWHGDYTIHSHTTSRVLLCCAVLPLHALISLAASVSVSSVMRTPHTNEGGRGGFYTEVGAHTSLMRCDQGVRSMTDTVRSRVALHTHPQTDRQTGTSVGARDMTTFD